MGKRVILPGLIAGIAMLIAGLVLSRVYNLILPSIALEYVNPAIFRPWSDPLMSLYFLHPFILGIILSWAWSKTKDLFRAKNIFERASKFGFSYFLIASIPGMFITYSSFQVSLAMTLSWSLNGLIQAIIAGMVFVKMNK